MSRGSKAIEAYSFLVALANDRVIDHNELAFIEKLLLEDGRVDDEERAVLHNILGRVDETALSPEMKPEISAFRARYGIG